MLIVQKYGGTSLEDSRRILAAAERVVKLARQGHRMVIVVSAQGDTTDRLIAKAACFAPRSVPRELDAYMAAGEQISAALMAMAITDTGHPAVSLTGWQAGILTEDVYTNARILKVDTRRILSLLDEGKIVVVAGFQGVTASGDIATLGRGGSDTTAVALAAYLQADACQIYTDVDGVYDRDPRRYPDAVKYPRISYGDMLTLARQGAQVLHDRCVELAAAHGVTVEVLSAFREVPGTLVGDLA